MLMTLWTETSFYLITITCFNRKYFQHRNIRITITLPCLYLPPLITNQCHLTSVLLIQQKLLNNCLKYFVTSSLNRSVNKCLCLAHAHSCIIVVTMCIEIKIDGEFWLFIFRLTMSSLIYNVSICLLLLFDLQKLLFNLAYLPDWSTYLRPGFYQDYF